MKQQFARFAKYAVKSSACSTALLFAVPTTLHATLPQLWPTFSICRAFSAKEIETHFRGNALWRFSYGV